MDIAPPPDTEPDDLLQAALLRLQRDTGADLVLLGEVLSEPVMRVRSLCCRLDGRWLESFSYLLDTHPCGAVPADGGYRYLADAAGLFPQAYLLKDNGLRAYAGLPVCLHAGQPNGMLVIMSRQGFAAPAQLHARLAQLAGECVFRHGVLADAVERARLLEAGRVGDAFFREYVLDNPTGVSFSEYMPPVPIDLPEAELVDRLLSTAFVVACNRAMARMFGFADVAGFLGQRPLDLNGPDKGLRVIEYWRRMNYDIRDVESQTVDAEGNISWVRGSALGSLRDGKLAHFWTKRSDITAQKRYESAIQHKVHHDALTDLPNRYWLQDRMAELIEDHGRRGLRFCVGLLDLNGFKEINDTLGHAVGDLLLKSIARRLLKGLKPLGAELARLGGDEFAILIPETASTAQGERMAQAVRALLSEPFVIEDLNLPIDGSLGLAMFPDWSDSAEGMLRLADVAMYSAKQGGHPHLWYHPEIDKHSKRRLALFSSLAAAVQHDEMFLEYQPKIDAQSGQVAGFEALIRWQHPSHGLIPPLDFIPFAETSAAIGALTRWVLGEAIRQGGEWLAQGRALGVAVNISARNLLDEQLEPYILACLAEHAYPARLLELEITESAVMTRPAQAMVVLQSLRSHGISITIDDFGTGYSSLAYLARLPVTSLKVDRGFVKDMLRSDTDQQIVRAIIGLAHQCRLLVVAEGVEDAETLRALRGMGCDQLQGYLIARPLRRQAAGTWLAAHEAKPDRLAF